MRPWNLPTTESMSDLDSHERTVSQGYDRASANRFDWSVGIAVIPDTTSIPQTLKRSAIDGLDARRTVHLYGVAGRERTTVASAVMRMLRGADWQQVLNKSAGR